MLLGNIVHICMCYSHHCYRIFPINRKKEVQSVLEQGRQAFVLGSGRAKGNYQSKGEGLKEERMWHPHLLVERINKHGF